jgi:hypothetical protein
VKTIYEGWLLTAAGVATPFVVGTDHGNPISVAGIDTNGTIAGDLGFYDPYRGDYTEGFFRDPQGNVIFYNVTNATGTHIT